MTSKKNDLGVLNSCYDGIPTVDTGNVLAKNPNQPEGQECSNCKYFWASVCTFNLRSMFRPSAEHWCDEWTKRKGV